MKYVSFDTFNVNEKMSLKRKVIDFRSCCFGEKRFIIAVVIIRHIFGIANPYE